MAGRRGREGFGRRKGAWLAGRQVSPEIQSSYCGSLAGTALAFTLPAKENPAGDVCCMDLSRNWMYPQEEHAYPVVTLPIFQTLVLWPVALGEAGASWCVWGWRNP